MGKGGGGSKSTLFQLKLWSDVGCFWQDWVSSLREIALWEWKLWLDLIQPPRMDLIRPPRMDLIQPPGMDLIPISKNGRPCWWFLTARDTTLTVITNIIIIIIIIIIVNNVKAIFFKVDDQNGTLPSPPFIPITSLLPTELMLTWCAYIRTHYHKPSCRLFYNGRKRSRVTQAMQCRLMQGYAGNSTGEQFAKEFAWVLEPVLRDSCKQALSTHWSGTATQNAWPLVCWWSSCYTMLYKTFRFVVAVRKISWNVSSLCIT